LDERGSEWHRQSRALIIVVAGTPRVSHPAKHCAFDVNFALGKINLGP
jgi:hypothetical protein